MKTQEKEMLQNPSFVRRIVNYKYKCLVEGIINAWIDTRQENPSLPDIPEQDFSRDFVEVVAAIREAVEKQ